MIWQKRYFIFDGENLTWKDGDEQVLGSGKVVSAESNGNILNITLLHAKKSEVSRLLRAESEADATKWAEKLSHKS